MTKPFSAFAILLLTAATGGAAVSPDLAEYARKFEQFPATKGQGSESERLQKLFDLSWDYLMHASPEFATFVGYPGLNDRWSDASFENIEHGRATSRKILEALLSVDRAQLGPAEQVNFDLARRRLEQGIAGDRFHREYLAVTQVGGVQQGIPQEKAKEIVKFIKDTKLKVQSSIQGDVVRVSGRDRDTLQEVIAALRDHDFGIDMEFTNYRSN